jgi:hypothetical protein
MQLPVASLSSAALVGLNGLKQQQVLIWLDDQRLYDILIIVTITGQGVKWPYQFIFFSPSAHLVPPPADTNAGRSNLRMAMAITVVSSPLAPDPGTPTLLCSEGIASNPDFLLHQI